MIKKIFNKDTALRASLSILSILKFLIYGFILIFVIEAICRGGFTPAQDFVKKFFSKFAFNYLIVLLTLSPCFLFKRRSFAYTLITSLWISAAIGNNLVLKFRGTPLTGADLGMIKSGLEISNQYLSTNQMVLIAAALLVLIGSLIFLFIKCKKAKLNYLINIILVVSFILYFPNITNNALKKGIVTNNFWDITAKYSEYGFPYSFLNSVANNGIAKPSTYSKNTITSLQDKLNNDNVTVNSNEDNSTTVNVNTASNGTDDILSDSIETKPNIIIVQLESFIDPSWITNATYNTEVIPNFRALSENYSSGLLRVPSIGGGTANTEFEVITGMSTAFFGAGEFPFNTLVSSKTVPSLAYYLRDLNYDTNAFHNHSSLFYCRNKVYKNFGFDSFTSIELMPIPERTPAGWAKDKVLVDQIKSALTQSENPDLVFAVSVQGHGGYPNTDLENKEIEITNDYNTDTKLSLQYYLNQVYEMDQFVGNLVEMVQALDEPTIIAFYGDHFPSVGLTPENLTIGNLKQTPYVIWNNFDLPKMDKDLETYELTSSILSSINFPSTTLTMLHESDLDKETKLEYLNLLEYDMLYGKNYTNDYQELKSSESFKYGINDVKVNDAIISSDSIKITGGTFNNNSKVYVNDKLTETIFVDENTLTIDTNAAKAGDTITVKQIVVRNALVLSTSNEVTVK